MKSLSKASRCPRYIPHVCVVCFHTSPGSSAHCHVSLWPSPAAWPVSVTTKEENVTVTVRMEQDNQPLKTLRTVHSP